MYMYVQIRSGNEYLSFVFYSLAAPHLFISRPRPRGIISSLICDWLAWFAEGFFI